MWEELDKGPACDWDEPSGNAPCFRSWKADTVAFRYFPKLFNVINGTTLIGEVLPDYSRSLKFRLTVRDNALLGGGVTYNEDIVTLSVVNTTVPFKVTFPDTQQPNIAIGTPTNINWDVATTDVSPINCPTVKILLSIDGGYTYPVTLAENTANDGYEVVMVPMDVNLLTSDARIMVQSVGNVFYDISDNDFNITDNVGIGGPGGLDAEVDVFPNPVNGTLNVAIDGLTTAQAVISIQDVIGRVVAEKIITDTHMPQQFTFDMNSMIPGIYMVGITCDDGSIVKKIVKQ
jgi:hypothetical protein